MEDIRSANTLCSKTIEETQATDELHHVRPILIRSAISLQEGKQKQARQSTDMKATLWFEELREVLRIRKKIVLPRYVDAAIYMAGSGQ